jgi:hypothetical protein
MSDRGPAQWERLLENEGMPAELPAQPSWRQMSARRAPRRPVELPSDRAGYRQTVGDRAGNFLCDAQHVPAVCDLLLELYWRGDWTGFPAWHRSLIWAVAQEGQTVASFCQAHGSRRRRPYMQAWRALAEHKRRAGIGDGKMASGNGNDKASRVEQTAAVRVKAFFNEKLPPMLGLGYISWAEGELVMGGRFVKIPYPENKPHQHHAHALIPVGPGVTIAVLKE